MKHRYVAALAACIAPALLAAAPSPAPSSGFDQFVGSWNCSTMAGSSVTMQFTSKPDGTFAAHTTWKNGPASGTFDHSFVKASDGSWNTTQIDDTKAVVFQGSSKGFDEREISFYGTEHAESSDVRKRETLRVTSPTEFEHVWYAADSDGHWHPTSFTECTKV